MWASECYSKVHMGLLITVIILIMSRSKEKFELLIMSHWLGRGSKLYMSHLKNHELNRFANRKSSS